MMQERPDLDAIGARLAIVRKRIEALSWDDYNVRLIAKPLLLEDIPALLAYVRELEATRDRDSFVSHRRDLEEQKVREIAEHEEDAYAKGYKDGLKRPKP